MIEPPSLSYLFVIKILITINIINTNDNPEPACQLLACLNSCSMTLPMSKILAPPSKSEITKVVSAGTKTIVIPEITPGRDNGKITLENVKMGRSQCYGNIRKERCAKIACT